MVASRGLTGHGGRRALRDDSAVLTEALPQEEGHMQQVPRIGLGPVLAHVYVALAREFEQTGHLPIAQTRRDELIRSCTQQSPPLVVIQLRERGVVETDASESNVNKALDLVPRIRVVVFETKTRKQVWPEQIMQEQTSATQPEEVVSSDRELPVDEPKWVFPADAKPIPLTQARATFYDSLMHHARTRGYPAMTSAEMSGILPSTDNSNGQFGLIHHLEHKLGLLVAVGSSTGRRNDPARRRVVFRPYVVTSTQVVHVPSECLTGPSTVYQAPPPVSELELVKRCVSKSVLTEPSLPTIAQIEQKLQDVRLRLEVADSATKVIHDLRQQVSVILFDENELEAKLRALRERRRDLETQITSKPSPEDGDGLRGEEARLAEMHALVTRLLTLAGQGV